MRLLAGWAAALFLAVLLPWISDLLDHALQRPAPGPLPPVFLSMVGHMEGKKVPSRAAERAAMERSLSLESSLSLVLFRLQSVARTHRLRVTGLKVLSCQGIDREVDGLPHPWLEEHQISLSLEGPTTALNQYAGDLSEASLPVLVESIQYAVLDDTPERPALLRLKLKTLNRVEPAAGASVQSDPET